MTITKNAVLAICVAGVMSGCANMSDTEQRTLSGAAIGTAAGAVIGQVATGRPLTGAAVGAAAGAASGWLYDRHKRQQEEGQ